MFPSENSGQFKGEFKGEFRGELEGANFKLGKRLPSRGPVRTLPKAFACAGKGKCSMCSGHCQFVLD